VRLATKGKPVNIPNGNIKGKAAPEKRSYRKASISAASVFGKSRQNPAAGNSNRKNA
jgi:hypothetical protein